MRDKPLYVGGYHLTADSVNKAIAELQQLAIQAQAGLTEPTPCQIIVYDLLKDHVDFNEVQDENN